MRFIRRPWQQLFFCTILVVATCVKEAAAEQCQSEYGDASKDPTAGVTTTCMRGATAATGDFSQDARAAELAAACWRDASSSSDSEAELGCGLMM